MKSELANEGSNASDNNLVFKNQSLPDLTDKKYRTFFPKKSIKKLGKIENMENLDNFNELYISQIKNKKLGKLNKLRLNNTCKNLFRKSRNIKDYNTGGLQTLDFKFNKLKGFEHNIDVCDCGYNSVKESKSFKTLQPGKYKRIKFTC